MTLYAVEALRRHAHQIARAFNATLVECAELRPEDAAASNGHRVAICAPIIDETTYAVALHEIGHLAAPSGDLHGTHGLTIEAERAAWEWAEHYALDWTPAMAALREWAFSTYANRPTPPIRPTPTVTVNRDAATFAANIRWGKK